MLSAEGVSPHWRTARQISGFDGVNTVLAQLISYGTAVTRSGRQEICACAANSGHEAYSLHTDYSRRLDRTQTLRTWAKVRSPDWRHKEKRKR